jgi:CubicO group peptidase (beta-lactamase class C family)
MSRTTLFAIFLISVTFCLIIISQSCSKSIDKNDRVVRSIGGKLIDIEQLDGSVIKLMDSLKMPGLSMAIINNGKIAFYQVYGIKNIKTHVKVDSLTIFEAASLSKPLFAFFVMKQVDKGLIDLDKPLYQYLPNQDIENDERYKLITARMILSHTSGFPNWREGRLDLKFTPGTNFSYSGEGYQYLPKVVAELNHIPIQKLDSLFQLEIAEPIKAKRLYFSWNDDISTNKASGHKNGEVTGNGFDIWDQNNFGAAGGLQTDALNYARFLTSIMNQKVLTQRSLDEMLKKQIELPGEDINAKVIGATHWSLGFGMSMTNNGIRYWHAGNNGNRFQAWCHFNPTKQYGLVILSNSDKIQSTNFLPKLGDLLGDEIQFDLNQL